MLPNKLLMVPLGITLIGALIYGAVRYGENRATVKVREIQVEQYESTRKRIDEATRTPRTVDDARERLRLRQKSRESSK